MTKTWSVNHKKVVNLEAAYFPMMSWYHGPMAFILLYDFFFFTLLALEHFIFNHYWLTSLIKPLDNNAEYQEHRLINIKHMDVIEISAVFVSLLQKAIVLDLIDFFFVLRTCGCLCLLILDKMIELASVVLSRQLFTLFTIQSVLFFSFLFLFHLK